MLSMQQAERLSLSKCSYLNSSRIRNMGGGYVELPLKTISQSTKFGTQTRRSGGARNPFLCTSTPVPCMTNIAATAPLASPPPVSLLITREPELSQLPSPGKIIS